MQNVEKYYKYIKRLIVLQLVGMALSINKHQMLIKAIDLKFPLVVMYGDALLSSVSALFIFCTCMKICMNMSDVKRFHTVPMIREWW